LQEPIIQNISKHVSLDRGEANFFLSILNEKKLSKKELVLSEGQICKHIHFVNSGILRAYYSDKSGKDTTVMFAVSDWWITDMFCFIKQQPAMLNIEAIEDSNILQLHKKDLDELYIRVPKFERFFRIIMENAYIREQLRVIENLALPAEERYKNFLTKYPQIAKQVSQKRIASYLGITPEFLSVLRGSQSKKIIS
jgi:CRP/FNR family transcriptional regulator, anaerobic regulatory protein